MQERHATIEQLAHARLTPQAQRIVEQLGLGVPQPTRQRDGRAHVRERVMGLTVVDPVGGGEMLELEGGGAVLARRPPDPVRSQGMGEPQRVDQIPAGIAVAPLARVGIEQVAIEQVARDLVVEAHAVVSDPAGSGDTQLGVDGGGKLGLDQPLALGELWGDAGDDAGLGVRKEVGRGTAKEHDRFADLVEIGVRTDRGELRGPVTTRIRAPGLVVVPEKGRRVRATGQS